MTWFFHLRLHASNMHHSSWFIMVFLKITSDGTNWGWFSSIAPLVLELPCFGSCKSDWNMCWSSILVTFSGLFLVPTSQERERESCKPVNSLMILSLDSSINQYEKLCAFFSVGYFMKSGKSRNFNVYWMDLCTEAERITCSQVGLLSCCRNSMMPDNSMHQVRLDGVSVITQVKSTGKLHAQEMGWKRCPIWSNPKWFLFQKSTPLLWFESLPLQTTQTSKWIRIAAITVFFDGWNMRRHPRITFNRGFPQKNTIFQVKPSTGCHRQKTHGFFTINSPETSKIYPFADRFFWKDPRSFQS